MTHGSNRSNKPTIYLTPENRTFLEASGGGSLSGKINAVIRRYAALVRQTELPPLTPAQIAYLTLVFEEHSSVIDKGTSHDLILHLTNLMTHPLTGVGDPALAPLRTYLEGLSPAQLLTLRERIVRQMDPHS